MLTFHHLLQGIQNTEALARVIPCLLLLFLSFNCFSYCIKNEFHYDVSYMYSIIFGPGGCLTEVFILRTLLFVQPPPRSQSFHVLPRVLKNEEINSSLLIVKYKKKV